MAVKSNNGTAGAPSDKKSIHLEHYDALDRLMARSGWEGEEWLRSFAAESRRIGEALGSLREDVSEEMALNKKRGGMGFSPLSRLHSVMMCQAAASTLADVMRETDLEPPVGKKGGEDLERRSRLDQAINRSYGGAVFISESRSWVAALHQRLKERWPALKGMQLKLAQRISETPGFTVAYRSEIIAGLSERPPPMDGGDVAEAKAKSGAPYEPTSHEGSDSLQDFNHAPNELARDVRDRAVGLFLLDPSARLEARFYALVPCYGYDHPLFTRRYPNGVFDGATLLLPNAKLAAGMGTPQVFERAMAVLSQAAREALGVEDGGEKGLYLAEPGSLTRILLSCGLIGPAERLGDSFSELERVEGGFHSVDVANALRSICLEGLGFPATPPLSASSPRPLDDSLREAAWLGWEERIDSLIKAGADPLSTSSEGISALMLAAATGNVNRVQRLAPLSEAALKDRSGKSARDYAELSGGADSSLVKWLDARAVSVAERDDLLEAAEAPLPALTEKAAPKHRI